MEAMEEEYKLADNFLTSIIENSVFYKSNLSEIEFPFQCINADDQWTVNFSQATDLDDCCYIYVNITGRCKGQLKFRMIARLMLGDSYHITKSEMLKAKRKVDKLNIYDRSVWNDIMWMKLCKDS